MVVNCGIRGWSSFILLITQIVLGSGGGNIAGDKEYDKLTMVHFKFTLTHVLIWLANFFRLSAIDTDT